VPKASELKKGMVVELNGEPYVVKTVEAKSPSSRGASTLYKIRFNHIKTKQKLDESFKSDDFVKEADVQRFALQYSYLEGDTYYFMSTEDYSQYGVDAEDIEDSVGFLTEGLDGLTGLLMDDLLLGIEFPQSVSLLIQDTAPSIKGATAAGRTKPATCETGFELQVPEYLEPGELIKINTNTGKFMSRA
jgi:elongation factor P